MDRWDGSISDTARFARAGATVRAAQIDAHGASLQRHRGNASTALSPSWQCVDGAVASACVAAGRAQRLGRRQQAACASFGTRTTSISLRAGPEARTAVGGCCSATIQAISMIMTIAARSLS